MRAIFLNLFALTALTATTIVVAADGDKAARSGEAVFDADCAKCHTGGIGGFMSGAPDIDDADDWEEVTPKGLDELTANTITGIGEMAARGACVECTDAELRAAVEHILEKIQ